MLLSISGCSVSHETTASSNAPAQIAQKADNDRVKKSSFEKETNSTQKKANNQQIHNDSENSNTTTKNTESEQDVQTKNSNEQLIPEKVRDYILNGQEGLDYASKLNWSQTFLNHLPDQIINRLYRAYIRANGDENNIQAFAKYLTENAPIQSNWREMFESDFAKAYGKKVAKYKKMGNGIYGIYLQEDPEGKKNGGYPFVTLFARTGNYHG